jgi:hypothetical protein
MHRTSHNLLEGVIMATTEAPTLLHLFAEEVLPRINDAASNCWALATQKADPKEMERLFQKSYALEAIADAHCERLTVPQTDADNALLLVALIQIDSRLKGLDEAGVQLAVSYMMEYIR